MVPPRITPYTHAYVCLGFHLSDFNTTPPLRSRPFSLPLLPLNPNVVSIFDNQSEFMLNPWQVPYPQEYGWDPANLRATRAYTGSLADVVTHVQHEPICATAVLPPRRLVMTFSFGIGFCIRGPHASGIFMSVLLTIIVNIGLVSLVYPGTPPIFLDLCRGCAPAFVSQILA
ncbi:hypothetical protein B0H13DRAFT_2365163 [Mycena leptocephala]|nr:hypothetical protein B0H13DRAFT_2365163 [Mycena leptocephala]